MAHLNYHHLRHFWAIAHEGGLTRAARRLNVSQSALSTQLRILEDQLGHALFERKNKRLVLTEAGRIALDHADAIFRLGVDLIGTLDGKSTVSRQMLRVGAIATLSRNFQMEFLRPLLDRADVQLIVRSGTARELLGQLDALSLDIVLSNFPAPREPDSSRISHLVAEQTVSLVARAELGLGAIRFPEDLRTIPVTLPGPHSNIRAAFDIALEQAGIRPIILAEVDDMAMLRLLARENPGVTLVPPVVVRDEIRRGVLVEACRLPDIRESFYAITRSRRFPNALVGELLGARGESGR